MRGVAVGMAALVLGLAMGAQASSTGDSWGGLKVPVVGGAQSIGSPAAGCIIGAVALPVDGEGYQVLRPQRNRYWGHPRTIAFIRELGHHAAAEGFGPFLVGDMSQPRGGPMAYGHGSHQNGLDVDIWFRLPGQALSAEDLTEPEAISMVRGTRINAATWSPKQLRMLELAARAPEIDRIFVNPPIKAEACRVAKGDRSWLAKLRPWWGHDEHFHARLSCTLGDVGCTPQAPVPDGDGCGNELASWNAKPVLLPEQAKDKPNHRNPILPAACATVLRQPGMIEAGLR